MFGMSLSPSGSCPPSIPVSQLWLWWVRAQTCLASELPEPEPGRASEPEAPGPANGQRLPGGLRPGSGSGGKWAVSWTRAGDRQPGWWWATGARSGSSPAENSISLSGWWMTVPPMMILLVGHDSLCCSIGLSRCIGAVAGGAMDPAHEGGRGETRGCHEEAATATGGHTALLTGEARSGPPPPLCKEWGVYCDSAVMSPAPSHATMRRQHFVTEPGSVSGRKLGSQRKYRTFFWFILEKESQHWCKVWEMTSSAINASLRYHFRSFSIYFITTTTKPNKTII